MLLRQSDVLDLLAQVLVDIPGIDERLQHIQDVRAEDLPVYHHDICALIQNAIMTPTPSIEVRLRDGSALSVPVIPRWTPLMRRRR